MIQFIRCTILGGLFVVLPATLILLKHAIATIYETLEPRAAKLPFGAQFSGLWAAPGLILVSFVAGLILQIGPIRLWRPRAATRWPSVSLLLLSARLRRRASGKAGESND